MRAVEGQPLRTFEYRDYADMATIGRASAVADFHWMQLKGLIGFRNRTVVMVQWAWSYFSDQRAIRLITGGDPPKT